MRRCMQRHTVSHQRHPWSCCQLTGGGCNMRVEGDQREQPRSPCVVWCFFGARCCVLPPRWLAPLIWISFDISLYSIWTILAVSTRLTLRPPLTGYR